MVHPSDILQSYLGAIRRLAGVDAISFFVPALRTDVHQPLLLHAGSSPPVPELRDLECAEALEAAPWERSAGVGAETALILPSNVKDGCLVHLPSMDALLGTTPRTRKDPAPKRRRRDQSPRGSLPLWIGLRSSKSTWLPSDLPQELSLGPKPTDGRASVVTCFPLLALGGALAWELREITSLLSDPVSGLPGRFELQARLSRALGASREDETPLSLLLVNPDGFVTINERFGREAGDRVVREISERLRTLLRSTDLVAKYGGAILACVLDGTDSEGAKHVANKVLDSLTRQSYVDGDLGLGFSIGLATYEADEAIDGELELLRRADHALNSAKRSGGGRVVVWRAELDTSERPRSDELSGIFTGNMAKDYRHMTLLSEIVSVVAAHDEYEALAAHLVSKLAETIRADRVAIFTWTEDGRPVLADGFSRASGHTREAEHLIFPSDVEELVGRARSEARVVMTSSRDDDGTSREAYTVPLMVAGRSVGAIYLDGHSDSLTLDTSDHAFLRAIASQLAVALDRARLNEQERARQEAERLRLEYELEDLRSALQQAKLEYRSPQMEAVLSTVRRAAPTDATVLIVGESGTGKELIARTVHELSSRRSKPMVIVDCTAIPPTLIESELFGHERGAYTGADQRKTGRLMEAHQGTVMLDEVGELPLEVQTRLLRFVQERQLTPVGASRSKELDVRVVAATNRDLMAEVKAGRFREDLYYRLNVVRLKLPALRYRPDDILHLAHHFLRTYSILYRKKVAGFTTSAEAALLKHSWPGNVRELENLIQQAIIMTDGPRLDAADLDLGTAEPLGAHESPAPAREPLEAAAAPTNGSASEELMPRLRQLLTEEIAAATQREAATLVPLGKWLGDDLVLEADLANNGVASQAAARVGIPETTYRRRRGRATDELEAGRASRTDSWQAVREVLGQLVRGSAAGNGQDLMSETQSLLLEEVVNRFGKDTRRGSQLLGVSAPTFRRRSSTLPT